MRTWCLLALASGLSLRRPDCPSHKLQPNQTWVPAHISACAGPHVEGQAIPRQIWQTWVRRDHVPPRLVQAMYTWIEKNPEYEYTLMDDAAARALVEASSFPGLREAYVSPQLLGAGRADLWRLAVLWEHGGVYADVDTECVTPLREWIRPDDAGVTGQDRGPGGVQLPHQWGMVYTAQHPVIKAALEQSIHAVLHDRERLAGPMTFAAGARQGLGLAATASFVAGELGGPGPARLRVLAGAEFGGRVRFKYRGYFADLLAANVSYYQHELRGQTDCARLSCPKRK